MKGGRSLSRIGVASRGTANRRRGGVARIVSSGLGSGALLIGAAELALSEVVADPARTAGRGVRIRAPVGGEGGD
jgi:hypothetical protein